MTKSDTLIAILGDTHFGARDDSELFNRHFFKFYDETLFPFIEANGIKHLIQTGDFMDKRKNVNYRTLNSVRNGFISKLKELGVTLHVFPGNHDIFHRHKNEINSISELFSGEEHVKIYTDFTTINIGNRDIDIIPWLNKYNTSDGIEYMKKSSSQYCFGHFEIIGFDMYSGIPGTGGMPMEIFESYDMVISGHYHTRSKRGNITYVGTPYEMTWSDFEDPKGFHTLNLETGDLTFIENPDRIFRKAFYASDLDYSLFDFSELNDCIVKIIVVDMGDVEKYEDFIRRVEEACPANVSVVVSDSIVTDGIDENEMESLDTLSILISTGETVAENANLDSKVMVKLIKELYSEALSIGRDE